MKKIKFICFSLILIVILTSCVDRLSTYSVYFDKETGLNTMSKVYDKDTEIGKVTNIYRKGDKFFVDIKLHSSNNEKLYDIDCFYVNNINLYRGSIKKDSEEIKQIYFFNNIKGYNTYADYRIETIKVKAKKLKKIFKRGEIDG